MNNNDLVPAFDSDPLDYCSIQLKPLPSVPKGLILQVSGEINTNNAPRFQRKTELAIMAGNINLLFDCSGINYLSSNGVGSFVSILKVLNPKGGRFTLYRVQSKVMEVLQLLGFTNFLNISNDIEDAIKYLKGAPAISESTFQKEVMCKVEQPAIVAPVFPKTFKCPKCHKVLKAPKEGRFRCVSCKQIIRVFRSGTVACE